MIRLGLVGRGPWAQNYVRTAERIEGIEISAVAGRDWHGLLGEKLDAVIVATTPASHLEVAERCVAGGLAVLVEKPLCLDLASALRFRDLVERERVLAMVDHIHLYSPVYRLLKRLSPALGRITRIACRGGREGPFRPDVSSLWDWGSHYVALSLDLLGAEPHAVAAQRTLREPVGDAFAENHDVRLQFAGAVESVIRVGNRMPHARRIEVTHERGTLVYDDLAEPKFSWREVAAADERRLAEARAAADLGRAPLDCVLEAFRDALRGPFQAGRLDLAVSVVRVLESAQRALG